MRTFLKTALCIAAVSLTLVSCKKDESEPQVTAGFTWTENGGTTVQTASTATFSTQYKTLIAASSTGTVFEINLSGTTPDTYALGGSNVITYTKVTPYFIPSTGNVIITANANGKMSGSFQGSGSASGGVTSVAGTFTDIVVVP